MYYCLEIFFYSGGGGAHTKSIGFELSMFVVLISYMHYLAVLNKSGSKKVLFDLTNVLNESIAISIL
jgi:hypothetical protein